MHKKILLCGRGKRGGKWAESLKIGVLATNLRIFKLFHQGLLFWQVLQKLFDSSHFFNAISVMLYKVYVNCLMGLMYWAEGAVSGDISLF